MKATITITKYEDPNVSKDKTRYRYDITNESEVVVRTVTGLYFNPINTFGTEYIIAKTLYNDLTIIDNTGDV